MDRSQRGRWAIHGEARTGTMNFRTALGFLSDCCSCSKEPEPWVDGDHVLCEYGQFVKSGVEN